MRLKIIFIFIICLIDKLCFGASDWVEDRDPGVELSVFIVNEPVKREQQPVFRLAIHNLSSKSVKILNLDGRQDLIDNMLNIVITQNENKVPCYILISDPGTITENDYITLPSEDKIFFMINSYKRIFRLTRKGLYSVTVEFLNYPFFKIKSQPITFQVE